METGQQYEQPGFVSPTGGTALKVAGFAWAIMILGGMVLRSIHPLAPLFSLGLSIVCGVIAVVFGLLSLFGVGKELGTSRPVAGAFGILLGGLVACLPLLLLPAIRAARDAAEMGSFRHEFAKETGENPNLSSVYCAGGKLKLGKPSPRWVLADAPAATVFNPIASAAALNLPPGAKTPVQAVLVAEEVTEDVKDVTLEEYSAIAGGYFTNGGFEQDGELQEIELAGNRCLLATYRSTNTDEPETVLLHCLSHGGHLIKCICAGPPDLVAPAAEELRGSIKLFP